MAVTKGLVLWVAACHSAGDPRWGRDWEVPSDDPYLTGQFGKAMARGFEHHPADPDRLLGVLVPKHFLAYEVEHNRHAYDDNVSRFDIMDSFLPAWRETIVEGGAHGVMCAYNSVDGVPSCASMFLKRVLRHNWNFTGVVTSDSGAIDEIFCKLPDCRKIGGDRGHEYRNWTAEQATAASIKAGCDIDSGACISKDPDGWSVYAYHTSSAVNQSLLTWSDVDEALRHAFTLRFKLGLLDPIAGQPFWHFGPQVVGSDEHRNLSAHASERSLVLLNNSFDALPLKKGLRLAVIGPTADSRAAIVGGTGGCGANAAHPNWAGSIGENGSSWYGSTNSTSQPRSAPPHARQARGFVRSRVRITQLAEPQLRLPGTQPETFRATGG
eukprot:SAG31_NODE_4570_length_3128_cov_1.267745_3_plen_382_part_00